MTWQDQEDQYKEIQPASQPGVQPSLHAEGAGVEAVQNLPVQIKRPLPLVDGGLQPVVEAAGPYGGAELSDRGEVPEASVESLADVLRAVSNCLSFNVFATYIFIIQ